MDESIKDLRAEFFENQAGIGPAKTKGVVHGVLDGFFAGDVGNIVEIALLPGIFKIDGGGKDVMV